MVPSDHITGTLVFPDLALASPKEHGTGQTGGATATMTGDACAFLICASDDCRTLILKPSLVFPLFAPLATGPENPPL